jgi:hypothetical protein
VRKFIAKHQAHIAGTLSGFDRLVVRGTLRRIAHAQGMNQYLWANDILLKDFGAHVESVGQALKSASMAQTLAADRPIRYLYSADASKEDIARRIAAEDHITEGLVCVLTCVEPCWSFQVYRSRETKRLELQLCRRKCLFIYHYLVHPVFGFLNARIKTWFPFPIQICLNGREWLARQMDQARLAYVRQDNCFPWVEDWHCAQQVLDQQLRVAWPALLDGIARLVNPIHEELFRAYPTHYYWTMYQSEWAMDIVFGDATRLRELYPRLLQHAMTTFGSADVLRFLGRRIPLTGDVPVLVRSQRHEPAGSVTSPNRSASSRGSKGATDFMGVVAGVVRGEPRRNIGPTRRSARSRRRGCDRIGREVENWPS